MPELWSDKEAAEWLDVTPGRARALLARHGIKRVSGYPADQVRAITRRQGARTDLARRSDQDDGIANAAGGDRPPEGAGCSGGSGTRAAG